MMEKKVRRDFRQEWKERLITALTLAPTLAVLVLSAVYQSVVQWAGYGVSNGVSLVLGWLSILAVVASCAMAVVWKRRLTAWFLAVLFGLCFAVSLAFAVNGTTDLFDDAFFEAVMMALALPSYAYLSVAASLSSVPMIASLILSGLLSVVNLGGAVYLTVKEKSRE